MSTSVAISAIVPALRSPCSMAVSKTKISGKIAEALGGELDEHVFERRPLQLYI